MNHYIVTISKNMFKYYLQKVVSYKRNKVILTIDFDKAYKYVSNDSAIKASNAFNGEVKVI
jgi:hypothetical protein